MEADLSQPKAAIAMSSDDGADHLTHPRDSSGFEYHLDSYNTNYAVPTTQNPSSSVAGSLVDPPLQLDERKDNEESQRDLAIGFTTDTETDQSSGQKEETESERRRRIKSLRPFDYIAPMSELSDTEEVLAAPRGARAGENITNKLDEMQYMAGCRGEWLVEYLSWEAKIIKSILRLLSPDLE